MTTHKVIKFTINTISRHEARKHMSKAVNSDYILAAGASIVLINILLVLIDESPIAYADFLFVWLGLFLCVSVIKGTNESVQGREIKRIKTSMKNLRKDVDKLMSYYSESPNDGEEVTETNDSV